MAEVIDWLWGVGGLLLLGLAVLAFFPFRLRRTFTAQRFIPASAQNIWDAYVSIPEVRAEDTDRHPLLPSNLISYRHVPGTPGLVEKIYDKSNGNREVLSVERIQFDVLEEPYKQEHRVVHVNGVDLTPARQLHLTSKLEEVEGGTLYTWSWTIPVTSGLHWFVVRAVPDANLRMVQEFYETGSIAKTTEAPKPIWRRPAFLTSLLALVLTMSIMGWLAGFMLCAVILLHELGHWAAMRLTGQPSVTVMLIPFLGGVAVPALPYKTRFQDAFCSLMGSGFSAFLVAGLMIAATWNGGVSGKSIILSDDGRASVSNFILFSLASAVALLNLVQLAPFLPLDGGRVLQSIMSSFRGQWQRKVLMGIGCAGLALSLIWREYILAAFLLLGICALNEKAWDEASVRAMSWPELGAITAGYAATVTILILPLMSEASYFSGVFGNRTASERPYVELEPSVAEAGSYEIEPRFTVQFAAPGTAHRATFVRGGKNDNSTREDWRFWGKLATPGPSGWVRVEDTEHSYRFQLNRNKLKTELMETVEAHSGYAYAFIPTGQRTQSRGVIDTFTFHAFSLSGTRLIPKSCIGFHGMIDSGSNYVTGAICEPRGAALDQLRVGRMIDSIVFTGRQEKIEPSIGKPGN